MAANDTNYFSGVMPSPIAPDDVKKEEKYGLQVAQTFYYQVVSGDNSYFITRNNLFLENRRFANGKQPFQTYLDLLGIDGKQSFSNYDYHPRPIGPKFRDILVNTIMENIERIECTGLSQTISKRKDDKINDAAFRMQEGQFVDDIQGQSGLQLEEPNAFSPESEEELDLWAELNDKEKEEILMEEGINFTIYNNDWEAIKKEVVGDMVDNGMGFTVNYLDNCGRIRKKRILPEQMVYGSTNTLNLRDIGLIGHIERMYIVDVRAMFPEIPEKTLYQYARSVNGKYGNPDNLLQWSANFEMYYNRPYDNYRIDMLFFEYKVTKYIDYVKGSDKNGRPIFDYKKGVPENGNKKPGKQPIPTWYKGAWLIGADFMASWGEMPDLLRSNEDKEDVRSSYSCYMLNNDGTMIPKSPMNAIKSSVIQMDLSVLKIQHQIATAMPDGMAIDLDSVVDIDMGQGIGKVGVMKLREIALQTGDVYYSSSKISGEKTNRLPVEQVVRSIGDKISTFISTYNWELNNIRDYIGVNELRDGSATPERLGLQVMQNQLKASNTATAHLYLGWVSIMDNDAKLTAWRLWDILKFGTPDNMYVRLLGKKNADFIKYRKDITDSNYDVRIQVNMSKDDLIQLEENINLCLQNQTIELEDAMMVRDYAETNPKKAILYLSFVKKKRQKDAQKAQEESQMIMQKNQSDLVAQQMQQKMEEQKQLDQLEMQKVGAKGQIDMDLKMQELINSAMLEKQKSGAEIPEYVQLIITKKLMAEQAAQHEAEQQQAMQEQAMQQQMMQQNPEMQGQMVA